MAKAKKKTYLDYNTRKKITKDFIRELVTQRKENKDFSSVFPGLPTSGTYKGTRKTKHNEKWLVSRETADYELTGGELEELRYRCRQLGKDNPIVEGTIITIQEMAVGYGPIIQSRIIDDVELSDEVQDVVNEWAMNCDVTGEESLNQVTRNLISNVCDNGDVLVTLPMQESRTGIKTVINLIEADRISTPNDLQNESIRHGVQYNKTTGAVEGYWVRKVGMTEGSHKYSYFSNPYSGEYTFMPKYKSGRLSAWLFRRPSALKRSGQSRQTPLMATAIHTLQQMEDLIDATVIGERVAACIMGVIKSNDAEGFVDALTRDPDTHERLEDKYGRAYGSLQPGTMLPLRAGEDFHLANPQRNGSEIIRMLEKLSKDLAMKIRIPYAILFLDLANINFSSYRGGILEARKMLASWRLNIEEKFLRPILSTVITEGIINGIISDRPNKRTIKPKIGWPAWGYVDPTKEIKAAADGIKAGITSPQRVVAEQGQDAFEILEEIALYNQRIKELEEKYGIKIIAATKEQEKTESVMKNEIIDEEKSDMEKIPEGNNGEE